MQKPCGLLFLDKGTRTMKRLDRVELISDYSGYEIYHYMAGQQGKVIGVFDDVVYVEWDGYEEEKKQDAILREKIGEGPNIAIYGAEIPRDLLRELENENTT
jgi:hypothetical protein